MRRLLGVLVMVVALVGLPTPARSASLFTAVEAFSTKTGFRAVVAWQASETVSGEVLYGPSPEDLSGVAVPLPVGPDKAQMAVVDGLTPGRTYWFQVRDRISGETSPMRRMTATNAYNGWNGRTYTLSLVIQLDAPEAPVVVGSDLDLNDVAAAVNVMAERVHDATDGFVRLGTVLVTDTKLDYSANPPVAFGAVCTPAGNVADVVIETAVAFDSHTWTPWAIDDPCTVIHVGRQGQLVLPWKDPAHLGYVLTHELAHYALDASDLYGLNGTGECWNPDWDGSLMSNRGGWKESYGRWEGTELDRNETLTPCDMGSESYSWDLLRERYVEVPERANGPVEHVVDRKKTGNPDGGALRIFVLDHRAGSSSLHVVTPVDRP
ncbi:MAG TPA: hypothetical protein VM030_04015 [Acidimicrobiales bacterium]|nr:hypothetical protein [Acidimicrobiales bacterium]